MNGQFQSRRSTEKLLKALATLLDGKYDVEHDWYVFSTSAGKITMSVAHSEDWVDWWSIQYQVEPLSATFAIAIPVESP